MALGIAGTVVPLAAIGATMLEAALDILPATGLIDRLTLGRLLIVLAVVGLLVAGARLKDFRTGADIPIGLLLLAAAFTTVQGGWDGAPLRFLITAIATYYVVVATIRRLPNARSAIALVALTCVVATAGLGIAQVAEESFTGFYRDGLEPVTSEIVRPDLQVRAIGSFINPNLLASFLVLLGPIALATAAWVPRREMRWAVFGLTALAYIGLVLTFSRSAVLGAILGGLLVFLLLPAASPIRKAAIWTAAGLAVTAIAAAAATSGRAVGAFGRFEAWDLALEAAADEPVDGVGLGRSGDVIVALGGTDETFAHAHNLWLNWLTEAGPLAFLAIAFFSIWLVVEAARGTRRGDAFMAAALAGMVGFFVISLTDHPANTERVAITFWVLAGIIAASGAPSFLAPWLGGPNDDEIERPPPVLLVAATPGVAAAPPPALAPAPVVALTPEPDPTADDADQVVDEPAPEPGGSTPGTSPEGVDDAPASDTDIEATEPEAVIVPLPLDGGKEPAAEASDEPEPEPAAEHSSDSVETADDGSAGDEAAEAEAGEPVPDLERRSDDAAEHLEEEVGEPLPPLLAGVDPGDEWPSAEDDSADTGEIPRPPELAPDFDERAEADAPEAEPEPVGPEGSGLDPEHEIPPPLLFGVSSEDDGTSDAPGDPAGGLPPDASADPPTSEEETVAPASDEADSSDDSEASEQVADGDALDPVPEGSARPPALFFDQEAERDATEVGPLGAPPPSQDAEPESVAFYDQSAEPPPPTPGPLPLPEDAGSEEPISAQADAAEPPDEPDAGTDPTSEEGEPAVGSEEPEEPEEAERRGSAGAWITFESVADELRTDPAVTSSTMMAAPSLRREGTYFAALWHDSRLAVKLPIARSRAMIDEGVAEEFAPAGRTLDEWVLVSPESREQWRELLEEAKAHAADS